MDTFLFPQPMVLSGPIVQLIQTPSGATQLVTTSSSPNNNAVGGGNNGNGGGQPVVSASSNKNSSGNSSRSTKQILPKPPGNGANSQSGGSSKHNSQTNNNGSGTNNSAVNSNNNGGNHGARSLVTNMPSNVNSVGTTLTTGPLQTGPGQTTITPQILLGPPGNQKMSFITSNPPGTFLLNQVIPGLGSQPILIQGNLNNIGGPLQLTLRQQQPQSVVTVSSANGTSVSVASSQGSSTPLISTLAGQTSSSVQRSTHSTPTFLFSNTGPSVTGTTAPTMVMASGQHNFRGQNLIFTRPPNLIGPTGSMVQGPGTGAPTATPAQSVPQFIQIQTPNGPMLVALQTTPALGPPNGGSPIIQTHVTPSPQAVPITSTIMPLQTSGTVGNQNASNHPTLHTILQTSSAESLNQSSLTQQSGAPLSANSIIFSQSGNVITSQSITTSTTLTPHQNQHQHQPQTPHSSSIRGNSKARKETKGLNLADLLKETGILQESSPPQSPSSITIRQTSTDGDLTNNLLSQTDITQANSLVPGTTPTMLDNSHTNQAQPTMLMVPDQGSQASNILIAPGHGMAPGTTHQLRLSLAADGSVILQPNLGPSVSTANTILSNPSITNQTGTSTQIIQDLGSTSMASISNSKFIDTLRDSCGPGSSQPSPDSTTPTLDASTPTSASTISTISLTNVKSSSPAITTIASSPVLSHKQTLMQQLNAGSTMKVGDSVTSMTITPIMGPSYRDDSKSSSPFIPLTITSESIRESTNLKTTIKQELSSKSMMDHSSSESKTEIVSVPLTDILNSNNSCISNVSVTPSSSTSTSTTTSVLTMSNCDSLVQNPSMPVLLTNASLIIPDDASTNNSNHKLSSGPSTPSNNRSRVTPTNTNNSASPLTNSIPSLSSGHPITSVSPLSSSTAPTLVDQNGFQFVQISLNNQEFIERLEAQIKNLRALKSPKEDQKKLLQELLSLQKRMSEAKIQPQSSMFGESKVILTSLSQPSHTPELLLAQPQQLQQTQQQSQQLQQLQRKPISSPGPQSLPQEIQSHLQQMFSESQHETEQHHQQTQHTSMPSLLPKTAHQQNSSQLNQPQSPNPQFNTIIKLNSSTNSNQLHPNQPQIVTATQQQAQNVRLITSNNANNLDGNTTIQVGTQLITIAASPVKPSIQSSLQTTSLQKQSSGGSNATTIQVVRIGTPNTSSSSTNNKLFKTPLESPQLENEKTKAKICRFFQQQAAADQAAATRPDTKTPFKSRSDACKRLLRYHVFNAPVPTEEQLSKVDRDFEVISESLLKRKNELFNRFRYNLLKSNMIETPKAEYVMLNKLFINDENISLQRDKDLVAQGKELELPPPPESWKKIIRDSLEEEEQLSINRKRKSSALDEDFLADCTEIKKYDIEDRESGDTDDDEDDSEDEDDEEENAAEDIAKYLGSNHHPESVPDLGYYPDFSNNPGIALPTDVNSLNNPYTQRNGTQEMAYNNEEWKGNNFVSNNRRIDVWNNRYDNENDFAVSTILEGGENGESADHETDLDLSSIQFLDLVNCHW